MLTVPKGTVTFRRQGLNQTPNWFNSNTELRRLHVTSKGTIEDDGIGMLQVWCFLSGPIVSALTLTLNLHFSPHFNIDFKGKGRVSKCKWSGGYEPWHVLGADCFI